VGWAIAAEDFADGIRKVHDFLTVGAPTPLQHAGVVALGMAETYYETLREQYMERRALMLSILEECGFAFTPPQGAYYVLAGITHLGYGSDVDLAHHLVRHVGVAVVPGSSFYSEAGLGRDVVRFSFCKRLETLEEAGDRLRKLAPL